jgi:hypothetical protein
MRSGFSKAIVWMFLTGLIFGIPAQALPVNHAGDLGLNGAISMQGAGEGSTTLHFSLSGPLDLYRNHTIGIFDLNQMTADVNDPDFALQALQADRVIVLHGNGAAFAEQYDITVDSNARLGVFLLRDASLADFSRGRNPYRPIFSVAGSPGSHLVQQDNADLATDFLFRSLTPGAMMGASGQGGDNELIVSVTGHREPNRAPVVPEPATLALVALGAGILGCVAPRRRMRKI